MPCGRHPHPWVLYEDFRICECETICSFCQADLQQPEALVKHVYSKHWSRQLKTYKLFDSLFQVYLKRPEAVRAQYIASPCRCMDPETFARTIEDHVPQQQAITRVRPGPIERRVSQLDEASRPSTDANHANRPPVAMKSDSWESIDSHAPMVGSDASNHSPPFSEGAPTDSLGLTAHAHENRVAGLLAYDHPTPHSFPPTFIAPEAQRASQVPGEIQFTSDLHPSDTFDTNAPHPTLLPSGIDGIDGFDGPSGLASFSPPSQSTLLYDLLPEPPDDGYYYNQPDPRATLPAWDLESYYPSNVSFLPADYTQQQQ